MANNLPPFYNLDRFIFYVNSNFINDLNNHNNMYLFYGASTLASEDESSIILSDIDRFNLFFNRYKNIGSNLLNPIKVPTELTSPNKFRLKIVFDQLFGSSDNKSTYGGWLTLYYSTEYIDIPSYGDIFNSKRLILAYTIYVKPQNDYMSYRITTNHDNYLDIDLTSYIIKSGINIVGNTSYSESDQLVPMSNDNHLYGNMPITEHKHNLYNGVVDVSASDSNIDVISGPLSFLNYMNSALLNLNDATASYANQYVLTSGGTYPLNSIIFDNDNNPAIIRNPSSRSYDYLNNTSDYINDTLDVSYLIQNYLYNINSSEGVITVGDSKLRLLGKLINRKSGIQSRSTSSDQSVNVLLVDNPEQPWNRSFTYLNLMENFQFTKGTTPSSLDSEDSKKQGQYSLSGSQVSYYPSSSPVNGTGLYTDTNSTNQGILLVNDNSTLNADGSISSGALKSRILITSSGKIFINEDLN